MNFEHQKMGIRAGLARKIENPAGRDVYNRRETQQLDQTGPKTALAAAKTVIAAAKTVFAATKIVFAAADCLRHRED